MNTSNITISGTKIISGGGPTPPQKVTDSNQLLGVNWSTTISILWLSQTGCIYYLVRPNCQPPADLCNLQWEICDDATNEFLKTVSVTAPLSGDGTTSNPLAITIPPIPNEVEFRLSPPPASGSPTVTGDPEFLISYDPTENQSYWQIQIGGVWQDAMPVDGVRRGDGPPVTSPLSPTITDRIYVDRLNGNLYIAWNDSATKQWLLVTSSALTSVAVASPLTGDGTVGNPITMPNPLWEVASNRLRNPTWPASINVDMPTGHVGINATANSVLGAWDTVMAGKRLETSSVQMVKGATLAESKFIGGASLTATNNIVELVMDFPFFGNSSYLGFEFETMEANGKRAVISGSFVFGTAGNIANPELSLNGNSDPSSITVWMGTDGGIVKIAMRDTGVAGTSAVNARIIHRPATTMESFDWTLGVMPVAPVWTGNAPPNTQTLTGSEAVNLFGTVGIGQLITPLRASAPQFVSATAALAATATSVIFSNAANATLTIPSALTVIGQMLYVGIWGAATASKFIAPSAGQIQVTPAGVTAPTVTITTAVVYQAASDGNWYIVG